MSKVKVLLLSVFFVFNAASTSAVVYVSDLDDTLKITNTKNLINMVFNGFLTRKIWAGNKELYQEIKSPQNNHKLYILTSSPKTVKYNIKRLLKKHNIKIDGLFTRDNLRQDGPQYKTDRIQTLMDKYPEEDFVLLGDNSGEDHEIYHEIAVRNPGRVEAIYIRPVKAKTVDPQIQLYRSSLEVASMEAQAQRLRVDVVNQVKNAILEQKRRNRIVPRFMKCPIVLNPEANVADFSAQFEAVQNKINGICQRR